MLKTLLGFSFSSLCFLIASILMEELRKENPKNLNLTLKFFHVQSKPHNPANKKRAGELLAHRPRYRKSVPGSYIYIYIFCVLRLFNAIFSLKSQLITVLHSQTCTHFIRTKDKLRPSQ